MNQKPLGIKNIHQIIRYHKWLRSGNMQIVKEFIKKWKKKDGVEMVADPPRQWKGLNK